NVQSAISERSARRSLRISVWERRFRPSCICPRDAEKWPEHSACTKSRTMPDNLTPEQRGYCMYRIKGKDTGLEMRVRSELHTRGFRFHKHVQELPGKPDVVFTKAKVAVFIDGDFWHGYRFPAWEHKVSDFWKQKINKNRERDRRNHRKLN